MDQQRKATHRKNNHNTLLSLHHDTQIEPHLKSLKCFVDKHILDTARGYEPRVRSADVATTRRGSLHAQPADHE